MVYNKIRPTNIKRSAFDLSYNKTFSLDMGQLIPVMCEEAAPNSVWRIGNEAVMRFIPMLRPALTSIYAYVHYFFVPTRLLFKAGEGKWEDFISGGQIATDGSGNKYMVGDTVVLPRYKTSVGHAHSSFSGGNGNTVNGVNILSRYSDGLPSGTFKYSLWDYFGFPTGGSWSSSDSAPLSFPWRVYNKVMNDWYRDKVLQPDERDLDAGAVMYRNMHKDYFISALIAPQFSIDAPTLPITGNLFVQYSSAAVNTAMPNSVVLPSEQANYGAGASGRDSRNVLAAGGALGTPGKPLYVDLANSVTSDVNQLRILYATQRFLERNMVSGANDPSDHGTWLYAHYGTAPKDEVLQRAEYLGGSKNPILIGEVASTAETANQPQGSLAGNAMAAARNYICTYRPKEFGYIIGILSLMPEQSYAGGIHRQWLKYNRFDFLIPEMAETGEQAVYTQELYASPSTPIPGADIDDFHIGDSLAGLFGFQGRYDEYRSRQDIICGGMASAPYTYWNLARIFGSAPSLNSEFISAKWLSTADGKRIFSVQEDDTTVDDAQRVCICSFRNVLKVVQPLPYYPI